MIRLRTREGVNLKHVEQAWGFEKVSAILKQAEPYLQGKQLHQWENHLQLTDAGMLLADGIAADLFF
jgi:oxygen-independent coproporphyrinogen-3 oxidase